MNHVSASLDLHVQQVEALKDLLREPVGGGKSGDADNNWAALTDIIHISLQEGSVAGQGGQRGQGKRRRNHKSGGKEFPRR